MMKKLFLALLFVILLSSLSSAVVYELFENQTSAEDADTRVDGATWVGQTFTVGHQGRNISFNPNIVSVKAFGDVSAGWVQAAIYPVDSNGLPKINDTIFAIGITDRHNFDGVTQWVNMSVNANGNLTQGETFALILNMSGGIGFDWREERSSLIYRDGNYTKSPDGITYSNYARDTVFQLFGEEAGLVTITESIVVNLNTPSNNSVISTTEREFNATLYPSGINLTNATLWIYNATGWLINATEVSDSVTWNVTNSVNITGNNMNALGTYYWNIYACGINITSGIETVCDVSDHNFTIQRKNYGIIDQFYTNHSYDTDNLTFIMNISIEAGTSLFSANLLYNGTAYPATIRSLGETTYQLIQRLIDVPGIGATDALIPWNWSLTMDVGTGFLEDQTPYINLSVSPTNILTAGTIPAINYTLYDEDTLKFINTTMGVNFRWWLGGGTQTKNISYNRPVATDFKFYLSPPNQTFYSDIDMIVGNLSGNEYYKPRLFNFNNINLINGTTTEQPILLLNSTRGTNVIIEVVDVGLQPLPNYYVSIYRYYPGDNAYRLVENQKTGVLGTFTAKLIENDVAYKFEFRNSNNVLLKTVVGETISCKSTICTKSFVIEEAGDYFDRWENKTQFNPIVWNNVTGNFTLTWNDATGNLTNARLLVEMILYNGTYIICNISSTAPLGSLTCDVGDPNFKANYVAQAFATLKDGIEQRIDLLDVKVGDLAGVFGKEGLLWALLLLLSMFSLGVLMGSPPLGAIMFMVGLTVMGWIGIVSLPISLFFGFLAMVVLFAWAFKDRGSAR